MTWQQLKKFISKMDKSFLDSDIKLYDFSNGDEYHVDVTELLINECSAEDQNDGWVPYLSINGEEVENGGKTKKTSVD